MWKIIFTKQAAKDAKKLKSAGLNKKAKSLIAVLKEDPFKNPPAYEALVGNLSGLYSRRINIQHRLIYQVIEFSGQSNDKELAPDQGGDSSKNNDGSKESETAESKGQEEEKGSKLEDPENAATNEEGIVKVLRMWSHCDGLK